MDPPPLDDIVVPSDYVPSDVRYLLDEWHPRKLHVFVDQPIPGPATLSNAVPPSTSTVTITNTSLTARRNHNKNTRPAAFYDKHLADHLVLRHVKRLDSLVASLVGTVDKAIKDAYIKGPLPLDGTGSLTSKAQIKVRTQRSRTKVIGEGGVAEYYNNLTANFCLPVASTLALHPSYPEWISCLNWSKVPNKAGWAIADGVLQLITSPDDDEVEDVEIYESTLEYLKPEFRMLLDQLRSRYPDLAIWEMKSLTVGDFEVMNSILELALKRNIFDWKRCKGHCGRLWHNAIWASRDTQPHGVDALCPPWTLPPDEPHPHSPSRRSHRLHTTATVLNVVGNSGSSGTMKALQSDSSLSSLSSLDGDEAQGLVGGRFHHGMKRKHDGRGNGSRSPTKKLGKADSGASYQDYGGERRYVNAQSFLQQAWAQGVHTGSTILVLHSGNHELIGVRHRKSQTLYLSHLIEPDKCEPAYGKIHVGIYIAAIYDALDRVKQDICAAEAKARAASETASKEDQDERSEWDDDKNDHPDNGPSSKRRKHDDTKPTKGNGRTAPTKGRGSRGGPKAGKSTRSMHQPPNDNETDTQNVAFMHFCYGKYSSPHPATFLRKTPVVDPPEQAPTPPPSPMPVQDIPHRLNLSMDIILTSEKRPGSSGVVHIGTMEVEPGGHSIQVAVKLAFSEFEKATLEHEHKIYNHLHSKGVQGIPQDFGLFIDDELVDDKEGPYALIMSFAGDSLFRRESKVDSSVKTSMLSTLRAIHRAGVIHGDIRLPNLCATASGEAFIIDFSHASMSTSRGAKAAEITEICRLLSIDEGKARAKPPVKKGTGVANLRRSSRIKEMKQRAEAATYR